MSRLLFSLFAVALVVLAGCARRGHDSFGAVDRDALPQCTVERVHDGDTVWVLCDGVPEKVRLHCVDAPELAQAPWGAQSRDHLQSFLADKRIALQRVDTDRYSRTVARLWQGDSEVTERMVVDGWAVAYPRYCPQQWPHHKAQQQPQRAALGLWSEEGLHQTPWVWRAAQLR